MESTVSVEFQERAFKVLLSLPGNQLCADCPAACPDWASVNLGVFVCHKCSGVHRAIGLHITRIKSIKLDSWTLKQMFMMNCVNNEEANSYWEAKRPNNRARPNHETPQEVLKNFIYSKYVYKEFVDPDARPPLEHVIENLNIEAEKAKEENKEQYFQRKVKELEDMLKAKAMVTSVGKIRPFNSSDKNDKKMAKSTSPLRKPTEKTIENMSQSSIATQRVHSHPPNQETTSQEVGSRLLVSASTMPTEKKDSNAKNSNPFERLNLFEGKNIY